MIKGYMLYSAHTGLFLSADGTWVEWRRDGYVFQTKQDALNWMSDHGYQDTTFATHERGCYVVYA